ncbi:hypothetical protein R75461_07280 [Paraburkholderia nemoris]|nr:hypothetical protein [Paraburkholderia aspalathi]MBK3786066.1 hypothetical protein [Paraburkholderia aspalathi]CAE6846745.1 hypothetical protein R75461_07280 [Paraburkholderia nemoris]
MARHPEDVRTRDLFDLLETGHPGGGMSVSSHAALDALQRVRRFRSSRKLFPVVPADGICEVCATRHDGKCGERK